MTSAFSTHQRSLLEDFYAVWTSDDLSEEKKRSLLAKVSEEAHLSGEQVRGWLRNRKKRGMYKGKTILLNEQVRSLEWIFNNYSTYPSTQFKEKLAKEIDMSLRQVGSQSYFFFFFLVS